MAARYLGLDCHLILRNSRALAEADPGLTGNLLVERLAGAEIHQVRMSQQHAGCAFAARLKCIQFFLISLAIPGCPDPLYVQVTKEEYQQVGSLQLGRQVNHLENVPVSSNFNGTCNQIFIISVCQCCSWKQSSGRRAATPMSSL